MFTHRVNCCLGTNLKDITAYIHCQLHGLRTNCSEYFTLISSQSLCLHKNSKGSLCSTLWQWLIWSNRGVKYNYVRITVSSPPEGLPPPSHPPFSWKHANLNWNTFFAAILVYLNGFQFWFMIWPRTLLMEHSPILRLPWSYSFDFFVCWVSGWEGKREKHLLVLVQLNAHALWAIFSRSKMNPVGRLAVPW